MSHYSLVKTQITNLDCLVKALINMGFKEEHIEISETALPLKGYQGDFRNQKGNIRIKGSGWKGQNYVGGASNDLGWELQTDGSYAFHVSDYDRGKYNTTWQNKLVQQYSKEVIKEVTAMKNFFIESETTENGEIVLKVRSPF